MKHFILATDLALFFKNKDRMRDIITEGSFEWSRKDHRSLAQALLMTSCDLVASAKPWSIQTDTVKVIFQEFYDQGDAEKKNGASPMPMMDRDKASEMPELQVGFLQGICITCFELISTVLPETQQLRDRSKLVFFLKK